MFMPDWLWIHCVLRSIHRVDALGTAAPGRAYLNGEFV